jgi:hypothetical protein
MLGDQMSLRNFKGGSWDLRKTDRRKASVAIPFPERRATDRRNASDIENASEDILQWVSKSSLDE